MDDVPLLVSAIATREKIHPDTVKRWIKKGVEVGRQRIFLTYSMRGVKYVVRLTDLQKFYDDVKKAKK